MRLTRPILTSSLCLVLAAAGLSTLPGSAAAAGSSDSPSLTAKVTFGRSSYVSGQTVTATLTVRNTGSSTVRGVEIQTNSDDGDLVLDGHGFLPTLTIAAGKSATIAVAGHPNDVSKPRVGFSGELFYHHNGIAGFSSTVPVHVRHEMVTGEVFADMNSNGRPDRGEGLRGAKIQFAYRYGENVFAATSGAGGKFRVSVPSASYFVDGGTSTWKITQRLQNIGPRFHSFPLRAVRPLSKKSLTASMHFTNSRYSTGELVHSVITLTNTGSKVLRGIGASCDRVGDPNQLRNDVRSWGSLRDGHGVTLKPHRPTVFHVTNRVMKQAKRLGSVVLDCDFGYNGIYVGFRADAGTAAKVPGESGALAGTVTYEEDGHSGPSKGLGNVRIVLVDPTECPVYTRKTVTDATGAFRIAHAPAGMDYKLYLYPPKGWKISGGNSTNAMVIGRDTTHFGFTAARGTGRTPKVPTKCS